MQDSPGVRFPPPLLFVAGFLAGWGLERLLPLPGLPAPLHAPRLLAGWLLVGGALGLMAWALLSFARAGTATYPDRPAASLVTAGPYRFTRNPMYLAMSCLYLGLVLLTNWLWPLLLLPAVLWALAVLVIRREEAYLERRFGAGYAEYRARVRRWF